MAEGDVPEFVRADLRELEVGLAEASLQQLARYLDLLLEANEKVNLTAVREREEAWRRLIVDSLTVLPDLAAFQAWARVVDIGTGGGLPGIPVAIARPELQVTLLEATGKKVRLLEGFIGSLGLKNCRALQGRAEALGQRPEHRAQYDAAVSRAVGAMSAVLEYSLPLVKVGGGVLAMKGPRVEQELEEATEALDELGAGELQVAEAYPPSFENELVVVQVVKDRPTPGAYPRNAGRMRQRPLG